MVEVSHRQSCFEEDVFEFRLPVPVSEELADHLAEIGRLEAPIPDRSLRRLETDQFVLTTNVGRKNVTLRMTADCNGDGPRRTVRRCLDSFVDGQRPDQG